MDLKDTDETWSILTQAEKKKKLFEKQKDLLDLFLDKKAISQAQHDKSLRSLSEKMGI